MCAGSVFGGGSAFSFAASTPVAEASKLKKLKKVKKVKKAAEPAAKAPPAAAGTPALSALGAAAAAAQAAGGLQLTFKHGGFTQRVTSCCSPRVLSCSFCETRLCVPLPTL